MKNLHKESQKLKQSIRKRLSKHNSHSDKLAKFCRDFLRKTRGRDLTAAELWEYKREEIIITAMYTPRRVNTLGFMMVNPIRRNLDYKGIARRAFVIEPMRSEEEVAAEEHHLETFL